MELKTSGQKINSILANAHHVLLVGHQRPDADALGSLAAFSYWLDVLGIPHTRFCFGFLTNSLEWLVSVEPIFSEKNQLRQNKFDVVVVLDSGDLQYAGADDLIAEFSDRPIIINIDHHATNRNFGDVNLVDVTAASTTEIIFNLFKAREIKITPKVATALLAGLIFDTYNFTNPNTTFKTLQTAAELVAAGASLAQVSETVLRNKTLATLQVWGNALSQLTINKELGIATTIISHNDLANGKSAEVAEGAANFLNNLSGVKAAMILQEMPDGTIKGSLRTNDDDIDVSRLAQYFGGGGHRKAAGFKINGRVITDADGGWQIV
ncbi:MAG: bifunctional oligoribonuclease/PAP phosphatase NrnA [Patescibacteria group bacterium]|nr:bifunctional oligoribonuclease/PAP phosphatase NrnA [Patescibacteria group bacterium]